MSKHRVSPRPTHAEVAERKRLELIATDITKSEPERELARERIQQLRDASVARAKLNAIQGKDVMQPADEPKPEVALPVKPLREECESDEEFQQRLEFWQLVLNDRAAQKVLDSLDSRHSARESAQRTIRKSAKRRREMQPEASIVICGKPAPSDAVEDDRPEAERNPFKSRYKKDSEDYQRAFREWEAACQLYDYLASEGELQRENPEAYAAKKQAEEIADTERRRKNVCCCESFCGGVRCFNQHPQKEIESEPFIASPLQKETWNAQSQKFARERGEIVDPKPTPVVEPKRRDVACKIVLDGSMVWSDGSPCPVPLPPNTQIFNAPTPPSYVEGSGKVPEGFELDFMSMCWVRKS
jgi:hypothetical protein